MNISHHVALLVTVKEQSAFRDAGITLHVGYESFDIDEDDSRWEKVARRIAKFQTGDLTWRRFSPTELDVDGLPYEMHARCGRKKYLPFTRGFTPWPEPTEAPIFKSRQYFGSGASASRMVMIANRLRHAIREARL